MSTQRLLTVIAPPAGTPLSPRRVAALSRGGFSLVELVIVMLIISIAAAIAVPPYLRSVDRYGVDLAASRVSAEIRNLADVARATSTPQQLVFDASGQITRVDGSVNRGVVLNLADAPYEAELSLTQAPVTISFDAWGEADGDVRIGLRRGRARQELQLTASTGAVTIVHRTSQAFLEGR